MQPAADPTVPHVWRVTDLAAEDAVQPSGHAALDAVLPGGGWPPGLVELLQDRAGAHLWQLLLPALAALARQQPGPVVLVGAPYMPFAPALAAQGLAADRLLWVRSEAAASRLWAAEQSLRCADVLAVLAWLPQVRAPDLRRLHLAARQHRKLLFAVRPVAARGQASPAPLRLLVQGLESIELQVLKRKGPPLAQPVHLPAHPPRLQALLDSRRRAPAPAPAPAAEPTPDRRSHGLDRLVTET